MQVFEIQARIEADNLTYRLEVEHERASTKARIRLETLVTDQGPLFECLRGDVKLYRDNHSPGPTYYTDWSESALARVASREDNTRLTRFLEFMRRVLVCGFYPPNFGTESSSETVLLERDAHNFADWYRHALQERPDLIPQFMKTMKQVMGTGFRGIRLERVGHETRALMIAFVDHEDTDDDDDSDLRERYELRFDEISDGQRALVALYGLIHLSRGQGYTLFLDEPDNYVALAEIQPWLMGLEDACGDAVSQAVITSHHPESIDYLGSGKRSPAAPRFIRCCHYSSPGGRQLG